MRRSQASDARNRRSKQLGVFVVIRVFLHGLEGSTRSVDEESLDVKKDSHIIRLVNNY